MDLIPDPPGRILDGEIFIDNFNILSDLKSLAKIRIRSETDVKIKRNKGAIKRHNFILSKIRGNKISMIFQEPTTALNPVFTLERQVGESIQTHRKSELVDSILLKKPLDLAWMHEELRRMISEFEKTENTDSFTKQALDSLSAHIPDEELRSYVFSIIISRGVKAGRKLKDAEQVLELGNIPNAVKKLLEMDKKLDALQRAQRLEIIAGSDQRVIAEAGSKVRSAKMKLRLAKLNFIAGRRYKEVIRTQTNMWVEQLLKQVSIPDSHKILSSYPHELSGGMQQRVMIAMALSCNPSILIADEPTTALDVTIQAQILDLMKKLKSSMQASVVLITHDLGVISEVCDRVAVMYAGLMVETGNVRDIFKDPKHPYTKGLLEAIPRLDVPGKKLSSIPGSVPNLLKPPPGCRFHPRCPMVMDICKERIPGTIEIKKGHTVSCFLYGGGDAGQ
jgi:peptide/nickel transport system ATP-binding protein